MNILYGNALVFGLCAISWSVGGWLIARNGFTLPHREHGLIGIALGVVLGNWAANILAQLIPLPYAFWVAALFPLVLGLVAAKPWKGVNNILPKAGVSFWPYLILGVLILIWYWIGRGLGLFDDFQNLPLISFMASGSIPPQFPLDTSVSFGYHYFQLLLAAQMMRLGSFFPWTAFDLSQALTLSLAVMLATLFALRLTRSYLAATLSGIFVLLSGGTRWALLLVPPSLLNVISSHITLLDSTTDTASTMAGTLTHAWVLDGGGPISLPFAYFSGINPPFSMAFDGRGMAGVLILLLLLLTAQKWISPISVIVTIMLASSYALADEIGFALFIAGALCTGIIYFIRQRSLAIPAQARTWLTALFIAGVLAILQGGVFSGIMSRLIGDTENTFFSFTFELAWPPSFVSANYGVLSIFNPLQLLVALAETGPIILLVPLLFVWYARKIRYQHWGEAFIIASSLLSIFTILIHYTGTGGLRNTSRFIAYLLILCKIYAVPVLWIWLRNRSETWNIPAVFLSLASVISGIVLLGSQLTAIQVPSPSSFITGLDSKVMRDYWNQLPQESLVFDTNPYRGATLFGRSPNSSFNWYESKPDWERVANSLNPYELRTAGYAYAFIDRRSFISLPPNGQKMFDDICLKLIGNYEKVNKNTSYSDFRRLYDISQCTR